MMGLACSVSHSVYQICRTQYKIAENITEKAYPSNLHVHATRIMHMLSTAQRMVLYKSIRTTTLTPATLLAHHIQV
jgi:hypothetical protein